MFIVRVQTKEVKLKKYKMKKYFGSSSRKPRSKYKRYSYISLFVSFIILVALSVIGYLFEINKNYILLFMALVVFFWSIIFIVFQRKVHKLDR